MRRRSTGESKTAHELQKTESGRAKLARRQAEKERVDLIVAQARAYAEQQVADARAELGHALGGVVSDDAVRLVECPRCRRDAVWWWLDPTRQLNAYCNHRKSCGWKGPVAALLVNDSDFSSLEG